MTAFEDYLQLEFPRRSVLLTKAITSYDGDPNDVGAPDDVKTAPLGTWFREETLGKWWRRTETVYEEPGGNPFDQNLNTTDDVQFDDITVTGLITDDGSGPLTLGTAGIPVSAGPGDVYTAGLLEVNGIPIRSNDGVNVLIGPNSGNSLTSGSKHVFIGADTGRQVTSGIESFALGDGALQNVTTGSQNVAIGTQAGFGTFPATFSLCVFIGNQSGKQNQNGIYNTGIGGLTLNKLISGSSNTATGNAAGVNLLSHSNSIFGAFAGGSVMGNDNVMLGRSAGQRTTGTQNTLVGTYAGRGVSGQSSFSCNSLFGYFAGNILTTGSNNLLLGWRVGDNLTTGSANILIGYDVDASIPTANDELNIGNILKGDLSTKVLNAQGLITDDGSGPLQLGTVGVPTVVGPGDVLIGKDLEVIRFSRFDKSVLFKMQTYHEHQAWFYSAAKAVGVISGLANDGMHIGLVGGYQYGNKNLILTRKEYAGINHGHSTESVNPTLILHSSLNPVTLNTRAGYLTHTGTLPNAGEFEIGTLSGDIRLKPATGIVRIGVNTSAPADASLDNGDVAFWVDEATNDLKVRVKYSGGTVKSGTVAALT